MPRVLILCVAVTWLAYTTLLALFTFINFYYSFGSLGLWLLQCLPLLLLLPVLVKHSYRAYSGLAMLILVYFIAVVPEVMSPSTRWYEHSVLALTLLIFVSSIYSSRWLQRWLAAGH